MRNTWEISEKSPEPATVAYSLELSAGEPAQPLNHLLPIQALVLKTIRVVDIDCIEVGLYSVVPTCNKNCNGLWDGRITRTLE